MQLGRAPAEDGGKVERVFEGRRRVDQRASLVARQQGEGFEIAVERLLDGAPGVALVADVGEGGGEHHRLALVGLELEAAVEAGRVAEAGDLGEEAADGDLRVLAGRRRR